MNNFIDYNMVGNLFANIRARYRILISYSQLVRKISGKNKILDLFCSRVFLGIPFNLYFDLCFYKRPWHIRKKFITDITDYYVKYNLGSKSGGDFDKTIIINMIRPYLKRDVLFTDNLSFTDFVDFTSRNNTFFYKPSKGCCGKGIKKIEVVKFPDNHVLYDKIKSLPNGILEETVVQHKDLDQLCPNLLQTIRFTVFKHKDGPKIIFATIKTSVNENAIVDNAHAGGIYANIDLTSGRIQTNAFNSITLETFDDYDVRLFSEEGLSAHPITGTVFKGFQIPLWKETVQFVEDISLNVDFGGRRLIGYDIAITNHGPLLIEANINAPGIDELWQTACKHIPLKKKLDDLLNEDD